MANESSRAIQARIDAESLPPRSNGSGEVQVQAGLDVARAIAEALTQLSAGFALIDCGSERVMFANEGLADLVGRTAREVTGSFFVELVDPDDVNVARRVFRGAASTDGPLPLRLRHAEACHVCVDVGFVSLPRNEEPGIVLMVVSRAPARSDGSELKAALDDAIESVRQREDLFAFAAHELRTPLTPLLLHLQAMSRSIDRDPAILARGLTIALGQVNRLTVLVDQLLDVARFRAGRLLLRRERVDLSEIVSSVVGRFTHESARTETPIEAACPGPVIGRWDPLRIDQIVTNLVSNAVKYGAGSPIFVSVRGGDVNATLTVVDHGPGIPREHRARIFERFERANKDSSVSGSGLGLWIVRRLAEAHGGSVEVFSESDRGTTFVVQLPFA